MTIRPQRSDLNPRSSESSEKSYCQFDVLTCIANRQHDPEHYVCIGHRGITGDTLPRRILEAHARAPGTGPITLRLRDVEGEPFNFLKSQSR